MNFQPQLHRLALFCFFLFVIHVQAKCSNPSVRREWRKLSKEEQTEWVDAIKCLGKLPHDPALTPSGDPNITQIPPVNTSGSFWDDIVYVHMDLNPVIHWTGYFLPWHRAYIQAVESALKEKCGYKGTQPYWNWTQDASDFYSATIFDDDPDSGLGGWGDPANDFQITTGGFAQDFMVSYPAPNRVRRNYTLQPFLGPEFPPGSVADPEVYINTTFTQSNADYMVNSFVGDFEGFQAYFESDGGLHLGPHLMLGGDMAGVCPSNVGPGCVAGPKWSANDPMFFIHHTMVDKLWYDWQNKHISSFYSFVGGTVLDRYNATLYPVFPNGGPPYLNFSSVIPHDGLLWEGDLSIWDVMDTTGDYLCYIYE
jgi:tyrosinase